MRTKQELNTQKGVSTTADGAHSFEFDGEPRRRMVRIGGALRVRSQTAPSEGTPDMAVYRLYKNKAFEPEAITVMTSAYADVCDALGLSDRDQSQANRVAKTVIEFAQRGVSDRARLRERVLQALQN
jgi:hypothetical protein